MMWLEADRMESLVINEENFTKEREVVKEERRLRIENPPYGRLFEDILAATYQVYPYKHLPIGSMEDLDAATVADVKEFFDTFYVPNNATLVIVGDFEAKTAIALARKHFGRIPRKSTPLPRVTVEEPPQTASRELTKSYSNVPLPAVLSAYHLPGAGHPDTYPLQLAGDILSSGQSSRLYRRLVYQDQLAIQAAGQTALFEGPSIFYTFAIASQGKDIKQVAAALAEEIVKMTKEPVSEEELAKAKNQTVSRLILGRQSVESKADDLGNAAVMRANPELYNSELQSFQKVTAADILRVCQKYLVPNNETRLWLTPEKPAAPGL
jgi:zinc protease